MPKVARFASGLVFAALLGATGVAACGSRTNLGCWADVGVVKEPPNLYFVLDRSTSMREEGKWTNERNAIAGLIGTLGSRANFGAAVFPPPNNDACTAGAEVMPPQAGVDAPGTDNSVAQAFLSATSDPPLGGTPTAKTLLALAPELERLPGHTFVILATDGGPNCNQDLTCAIDRCTSNVDGLDPRCQPNTPPNCCTSTPPPDGPEGCLDEQGTVSATAALFAAHIPLFVIGVPGSAPYAETLDEVARAGGTARSTDPSYYNVDTADEAALAAALADIVERASRTCDVKLLTRPTADVEVTLDGAGVPLDPTVGWTTSGDAVSFHGASCAKVLAGATVAVASYDECARR